MLVTRYLSRTQTAIEEPSNYKTNENRIYIVDAIHCWFPNCYMSIMPICPVVHSIFYSNKSKLFLEWNDEDTKTSSTTHFFFQLTKIFLFMFLLSEINSLCHDIFLNFSVELQFVFFFHFIQMSCSILQLIALIAYRLTIILL